MNLRRVVVPTFVLLLLLQLPVPVFAGPLPPEAVPTTPDEPPISPPPTGVFPVDRNVNSTTWEAWTQVGAQYEIVRGVYTDTQEMVDGSFQEPLTLYRDGIAADASDPAEDERIGGFGDWQLLGSDAWARSSDAAFQGRQGFTIATAAQNTYRGSAHALLVSPEIDLRTNPRGSHASGRASGAYDEAAEGTRCLETVSTSAAGSTFDPGPICHAVPLPGVPDVSASTVYNALYSSCFFGATQARGYAGLALGAGVGSAIMEAMSPACQAYQDFLDPTSVYARFQFQRRMNLATGLDGAQVVVFDHAPTSVDEAKECLFAPRGLRDEIGLTGETCRIVVPQTGYQGLTTAFEGESAYTGFSNWTLDVVDLTPWEGHSVWVGFYFASSTIVNPAYFQNPNRFVQNAGFLGFELDDVRVDIPAAPVNVRVRPLTEPSFIPPGPLFTRPTLSPDFPVPLGAEITNFAARPANVTITSRLLAAVTRAELAVDQSEVIALQPGEYARINIGFPALPPGSYIAHVCVERTQDTLEGDEAFCNDVPAADECPQDSWNADPCALIAQRPFDVRPVTNIVAGSITRSASLIQVGDGLTLSLPLTNAGNAPETVPVRAHLLDVATNTFSGDDQLSPEDRGVKTIDIDPGETEILEWHVQGSRRGQYRPLIQIGTSSGFHPVYDTAPSPVEPWRADPVVSTDPITIDGALQDWARPAIHLLELDGVRLQIANDDRHLFVTVWNTTAKGLSVFIDDLADHEAGPDHDVAYIMNLTIDGDRTNITTMRFDPFTLSWIAQKDADGFAATLAPFLGDDGKPVPGQFTYEFRLPINSTQPSGVTAAPGDPLGIMFAFCQARSSPVLCDQTPAHAPLSDGSGVRVPDGSVADELAAWRVIRLAKGPFLVASTESAVSDTVLGPGVGIGVSPPAYFDAGLENCEGIEAWLQVNRRKAEVAAFLTDKWNCGSYADDGRSLVYKGVAQTKVGAQDDFLPYSGLESYSREGRLRGVGAGPPPWFGEDPEYVSDVDALYTPPFEIPADAMSPTAVLSHQYSTDIDIEDKHAVGEAIEPVLERIRRNHVLNVSLEKWNGVAWIDQGALEPMGGYTSEESVGIRNETAREYFVDACPLDLPSGTGKPTPLGCKFTSADESWWWPQGEQPLAYSNETGRVTGTSFVGGSPWRTDLVPLFGEHFGRSSPLAVAGSVVRLKFSFAANDFARNANDTLDWGWRIGGLSVIEGDQVTRDIAITSARLAVGYDAQVLGLGPGTNVPVEVTLLNAGTLDLQGVVVTVVGLNAARPGRSEGEICRSEPLSVPGTLLSGQSRTVVVPCELPAVSGEMVAFRAFASLSRDAEDFRGNNQQRIRGTYAVAPNPAATVLITGTPRDATVQAPRNLQVRITNTGNVPLEEAVVKIRLLELAGTTFEETGFARAWKLTQPLPMNPNGIVLSGATPAEPPIVQSRDLVVNLREAGTYVVVATVEAPGLDAGVTGSAFLVASDVFYGNDFDQPAVHHPEVVSGVTEFGDLWRVFAAGSHDGSGFTGAADPVTGEIPASEDAYLALPVLDLTSARRATLSFQHRYELEQGFDAARVEMSTDGTNWVPLTPEAEPLNDLPLGYPSELLVGRNAFQATEIESLGVAYTGQSASLPINQGGWVAAEFDLTRHPQFRTTTVIDQFLLENPAVHPNAEPIQGDLIQFSHPSWNLQERDAERNQRTWFVENLTYSTPVPRSSGRYLWSGSAGNVNDEGLMQKVNTTLETSFATGTVPLDPNERLVLSFWEWRDGSSADNVDGTGGSFTVQLLPNGEAPAHETVSERSETGWVRRELDITHLQGRDVSIAFNYRSGHVEGFGSFLSELQANRGWFIDRVELLRRGSNADEILATRRSTDTSSWSVTSTSDSLDWKLITVGEAATDGGWHVEPSMTVPGEGTAQAWRFSSTKPEDSEGYPAGADSRLVTPLVDLRTYNGDELRLGFDHRFQFHGDNRLGFLGVDGGQIEYQVFDSAKGEFGPWQTLMAAAPPVAFQFDGPADSESIQALRVTGYTSFIRAWQPPLVQPGDIRLYNRTSEALPNRTVVQHGDIDIGRFIGTFPKANLVGPARYFKHSSPPLDYVPDTGWFLDIDGNGFRQGSATTDERDIQLDERDVTPDDKSGFHLTFGAYNGVANESAHLRLLPQAIQWVDIDQDGRWGIGDAAIIPSSGPLPGTPKNFVEENDFLLTLGAWGVGERVDALVGQPLMPPGLFKEFCRFRTSSPLDGADPIYLTTNAGCSGEISGPPLGSSFETVVAWMNEAKFPLRKAMPHPVALAFSGDSEAHYPDRSGWDRASFDLRSLVGQQVRFGFHAWTNPSRQPCGHVVEFLGGSNDFQGPPCDERLHGWTVANVEVIGEQFRGRPVQLRLRVATDDTMTKGDWRIDDLVVAGERYGDAVVVDAATPEQKVGRNEPVTLSGEIRNLGTTEHAALGLALRARRLDNGQSVGLTLASPTSIPSLSPGQLPSGFQAGFGPFPLTAGGRPGSTIPLELGFRLDVDGVDVEVEAQLVDLDRTQACGGPCTPRFVEKTNERGAGSAAAQWNVRVENLLDLELLPQRILDGALLVAEPSVTQQGDPVQFTAQLFNNGTVTPEDATATWRVLEIERKGDPDRQPGTNEVLGEEFDSGTVDIDMPGRQESIQLERSFTVPRDGLFRVVLQIESDGDFLVETSTDFLVGELKPYYGVDFGDESADLGWADRSSGETPAGVRFRLVDNRYVWGVTKAERQTGLDYCSFGGCNLATKTSNQPGAAPLVGLEGVGQSPIIDLGRVLGDQAHVRVRHAHVFLEGDGAAIEARPLEFPLRDPPRAAFACVEPSGDQVDAWFRLTPEPESALLGEGREYPQTMQQDSPSGRGGSQSPPPPQHWFPQRLNPLGEGPIIGGPGTDNEVLTLPLTRTVPFEPACPRGTTLRGAAPTSLVNYALELRLRTGTTPGIINERCTAALCPDSPREGALGYQVAGLTITSLEARVEPAARNLPVRDGVAKTFNARIVNHGSVGDTMNVRAVVDPGSIAKAEWFSFPSTEIFVPAGEHVTIPFTILVPSEPRVPRGTYAAYLEAVSTLDPTSIARGQLNLTLAANPLADLFTRLTIESEGEEPEPGEELQIFVTVDNLGQIPSDDVPVHVRVISEETGRVTELGRADLGPLCPLVQCGAGGSFVTKSFGWIPETAGIYRIEAQADPFGRLLQERTSDDLAVLQVTVLPPQRADLAVTDIRFTGLSPDGFAFAGGLVTVSANITNKGITPATNVQVRILAGTSELVEASIDLLAPGEEKTINATLIAAPGETIVRTLIIPTADDFVVENNELRRVLRVRSVVFTVEPDLEIPTSAPGGIATSLIGINNTGNAPERVTIEIANTKQWAISVTPNPILAAPNSTVFAIVSIAVPANATAGLHEVRIKAFPSSQPTVSVFAQLPVNVSNASSPAELRILPTTVTPGRSSIQVQVDPNTNLPSRVSLKLEEPSWASSATETTIPGSQTKNVSIPVTIPSTATPGSTAIRIALFDDEGHRIAQAVGTINVAEHVNATAIFLPQLGAEAPGLTVRNFTLTLRFTNDGNLPVRPVVAPTLFTEGARLLEAGPYDVVLPAQSSDVPVRIQVNLSATEQAAGSIVVTMMAPPDNSTRPPVSVAILPVPRLAVLPDLVVTDIILQPAGPVAANTPLRAFVAVSNIGAVASGPTRLHAFVNGEAAHSYDVPNLRPGNETEIALTWAFPTAGQYLIQVVADGSNAASERYEDNNALDVTVVVVDGGDRIAALPAPDVGLLVLTVLGIAVVSRMRHGRRPG